MIHGYLQVWTDGRSVDSQARQLTRTGCKKVFRETARGTKTDRSQRRMLNPLKADDAAMATRPVCLVRCTRDLLNTLGTVLDRKAGFRSLGDAWADNATSHGRLMLTVLDGLAGSERGLIRTRTGDGERGPRHVG
jgi:DNA invertase Pin-like site-specific DNA recombinase